jgi:hypothetical protein
MQKRFDLIALLLVIFGLLASSVVFGQSASDFTLFERIDTDQSDTGTPASRRNSRQTPSSSESSGPVFTLIGISKIASRTAVILRHESGEEINMPYNGGIAQIPGYEDYAVSEISGRSVFIRHPAGNPCRELESRSISCDAVTNISQLKLAPATSLASSLATSRVESDKEPSASIEAPINPFDAIRRGAEGGLLVPSREDSSRFRPRRIDAADVPPGMRVVSTPFGDRLVEI